MSLQGSIGLVTGGARGIGRAIARNLAAAGAMVLVNDRETEIHSQLTATQREALPSLVPTGRLTMPEEIAEAVSYLVSPTAREITGQVIHINGGMYFA